ncbi:MAG: NB-ARC domain-containing [Planctomycetota bacterium]|nr:MAG: NB-ARC domain-containing [Planctomycetota bacterium]
MRFAPLPAIAFCALALACAAEEPAKPRPVLEIAEPESMVVERHPFQHQQTVVAVAWSPDGKWLASCDLEGILTIWTASTGLKVRSWDSKRFMPNVIAWSPDGACVVTGNLGEAVVWDALTGKEIRCIDHGERVDALAFVPGTQKLVSGGTGGKIHVTDLSQLGEPETLASPCARIRSLAVSSDGTKLVIGGHDPPAAILSLPGGEVLHRISSDPTSLVTWVDWSERKDRIFARFGHGSLLEYDATTGERVNGWDRFGGSGALSLVRVPGGDELVGVFDSGYAFREKARRQGTIWNLAFPRPAQSFVALSPDGTQVAIPRVASAIAIVSASTGRYILGGDPPEKCRFIAWSPDGRTIFASRGATEVHAFEAATGKRLRGYVAPGFQLLDLAAREDGALVAATYGGAWLRVTDLTNGQNFVLEALPEVPAYSSLSEDGSTFVWWQDKVLRVRDLVTQTDLPSIGVHREKDPGFATLSPHGDILLRFGTHGNRVAYTDTTTGTVVTEMLLADRGVPSAGVLSPDGSLTALFEEGHRLSLCFSGQKYPIELQLSTSGVNMLRFSPDGRRLAVLPNGIAVFDSTRTERIFDARVESNAVTLAWSPNGRLLATHHQDGVVRIWAIPAPAPPDRTPPRDPILDWGDLSCQRADRAFEAAGRLELGGAETAALLRERLAEKENQPHIRDLIAQLGDESFVRRDSAREELHWLGVQAEPELLRALTGQPPGAWRNELESLLRLAESRVGLSSQNLRRQRAMQVLEAIGSAEAADVLRHLSSESPSPRERSDAQDALRRIEMRNSK